MKITNEKYEKTRQLALNFVALVCREFDEKTLSEIRRRNRAETNPSVCHTHDFCDANLLMDDAWRFTFGRDTNLDDEVDCAVWSNAWARAVAANFEVRKIKS